MGLQRLFLGKPARMETRLMRLHIHNGTDITNHIDPSFPSLATRPAACPSYANPLSTKLDYCRDDVFALSIWQ